MAETLKPITRRTFMSLIGAGAAVMTGPRALASMVTKPAGPTGDIWITPLLADSGAFSRVAVLELVSDALRSNGLPCPTQWAPIRYWEQIGHSLDGLDERTLTAVLERYFEGFVHGTDHAAFALELALAGKSPGAAPNRDEIAQVSNYLYGVSSTDYEWSTGDTVRVDVERFDLMLEVEEFKARPQTGAEYNGAMVAAASGMHFAAFVSKLRKLTPLVHRMRAAVLSKPGANFGDALCELLLGGIQVIAYQNDLQRRPDGVLRLANLLRRGYLVIGRNADKGLAVARVDWHGGRSEA